jgi:hypothetical protein
MFLYFKEIVKSKIKNEKKNYHKKKKWAGSKTTARVGHITVFKL